MLPNKAQRDPLSQYRGKLYAESPASLSHSEKDAISQAINYDWPAIQQHLIKEAAAEHGKRDPYQPYWTTNEDGTRTLHASMDSWWLKHYDEAEVLLRLPGVVILNTQAWNAGSAAASLRDAYGVAIDDDADDVFNGEQIEAHIERFPAGQFAAQRISGPGAGNYVGMCATMLTSRPPSAPVLPWIQAIGDMTLSAHEPDGDWLYGVEMGVRPMYRGKGIATALYDVRFDLVRRLNLRGMYAVGMLMGYREHGKKLDIADYAEQVVAGKLKDPTVSLQLKRGFQAHGLVRDYCEEGAAANAGILIIWRNPDYQETA